MAEGTLENQGRHADEGGQVAVEIASDGGVNSYPSIFVTKSWTPGASSLATPGYQRWRKEGRRKTTEGQQESTTVIEPGKDLTLFAMRLAVLEKTASNIGTLAFIWATAVLLGGYAVTLKQIDFWFVTVILVTEGARIFCRSHELEWQHQDSGTSTLSQAYHKGSDALYRSSSAVYNAISNLMTQRAGRRMDQHEFHHSAVAFTPRIVERNESTSLVSLVPFKTTLFRAKYISLLLYSMQLTSAVLSIVLSVIRLINRKFVRASETGKESNLIPALLVFYSLAVLEAVIFLLERTYWQYQLTVKNILVNASKRYELPLNDESLYTVKCFLSDVYSKCLTGSVVEGLKMDMLDYTMSWLQSDTPFEQLASVRALLSFSTSSDKAFSAEALKTIGTRQAAVERLIEMITWKSTLQELEIRTAAAKLLCNLVRFNRNSIRVAAISGSLDGIVSLLSEDNLKRHKEAESTHYTHGSVRRASLKPTSLPAYALGLRILINLAKNPMNCTKIGETRGLLTRLFDLIDADKPALRKYDAKTETTKDSILYLSLRLLGQLVGAAGTPGKSLRGEIVKVVGSISSLRGVLSLTHEDSTDVLVLQQLAAETLSSLALDDQVSEAIGRTGGVIGSLLDLFRGDVADDDKQKLKVAVKAGEALKMLVLTEGKNCDRIYRLTLVRRQDESGTNVVDELLQMLDDRERGHIAMGILSRLCKVVSNDCADSKARIVARTRQVIEVVMEERDARQEAAISLAARIVPLLSKHEREIVFSPSQRVPSGIVKRLQTILDENRQPSTQFPRLRRSCLELIVALLIADSAVFLPKFVHHQFLPLLRQLAATTSDVENYCTFCNDVGVTFHTVLIEQLVDDAITRIHPHQP